ncbi:leucine-rich repeat domain-containing protein [endosymbiont GvMRE of Glomus versiforme]|uniref:leucine-rich repeat domain-containing protein n=1 Tax=endosymbiont GvMRE of Glomus versiforme TaxID=2039283 RepID=UPI000EBA01A4|nr:hypothetical protein [endosymbiont GvMRE of Glomus versiforme]RHZ35931.1 Serine/threonine protein kinase [endosymbiont GvMRE of Glomus versiforme]
MTQAQKWLGDNYPLLNREYITKLDISKKKLENHLQLKGFTNLKELELSDNEITSLEIVNCPHLGEINGVRNKLIKIDIKGCPQLKNLWVYSNLLTNLDLSQNSKLEELNIDNNNFSEQDLSFLSHLKNLKKLWVGNNIEWRIKQGIYNHFAGSLEFLKDMEQLEWCDISNTDVDRGLEYLPKRVENFRCLNNYRPNAKVQVLNKLLEKEKSDRFSQELEIYKQKIQIKAQVQQANLMNFSKEV